MSLIGTAIGALVALVPARRPEDDKTARLALKLADLSAKFDALTRTREQLVNHIELIERQLDAERALASHWRGEAQRLARENRLSREQNDLSALYNQAAMQQSQTLAQQNFYNQQTNAQQLGQGFCNCVPSRAQVWGAHGGLVQRLNDREI
jgi:gas vesicle protein